MQQRATWRITMILLFGLPSAVSGSAWAQPKEPAAKITYKQTPLNVSEARFMREHVNQGFLCGPHSDRLPGRECTSIGATYAGFKAQRTSAYFLDDKLIQVAIWYPKHKEVTENVLQHAAVVVELEGKYGDADEVYWPREAAAGNVKTWEKTWKREGNKLEYKCFSVTLPSSDPSIFCSPSITISSIAGVARFNAEWEKARSRTKRDL